MGNNVGKNPIHIANKTQFMAHVIITPNSDWLLADLFVNVASIFVTCYGVLSSVEDIWKHWNATMVVAKKAELVLKIEEGF